MTPTVKRSALLKVFSDYDTANARAINALYEKPPCQKGCSACCYEIVDTLPVEAELIRAEAIRRDIGLRDRLMLWREAALRASQFTSQPVPSDYFSAHLACPLLDQTSGACLVYDVRPMACRAHTVDRNAADCAKPHGTRKHRKMMFLEPLRDAEWTLREAGAIEDTANLAWLLCR